MADEIISRDDNRNPVLAGITNDANEDIVQLRIDAISGRLLVSLPVSAAQTWTATGNTDTVTDAAITATSVILIMWTGAVGSHYYITPGAGSFTITAQDVVDSGTSFKYVIIG